MTSEVNLHVDDENLTTIVDWMNQGRYRIPEFQRDYVWDPSEVTALFDSVYNSYPIGSLFLWEVSDDKEDFFREERDFGQPSVENTGYQINFVLDGQQRLTSLYIAVKGLEFRDYDYNRILFDIDAEEFTLGKPSADHLVRVSDIWDMDRRYEIKSELDEQRERKVDICANRLSNYKVPMLEIGSDNIDNVIEIFERINQKGRDLDRFDIVNANVWSPDFNLRKRIDQDINKHLKENGFGKVDKEAVTQTLALIIEGSCTTNKQKNLRGSDVSDVWNDAKESFLNAVRYIKRQYNIGRVEFLPYQGLIALIAYYLHNSENDTVPSDHQDQIDRWFWRVVVSDHWESTRQTKMGKDTDVFDKIIDGIEIEIDYPVTITPDKLINGNIKRSKSKMRNAFLCILAQRSPRDFEDSNPIELSKDHYSSFSLEKHHIFPNAYLRQQDYSKSQRKSLMDITFLSNTTNQSIKDKAPHVYFDEYKKSLGESDFLEVMESHFIPVDNSAAVWEDNYEQFLEERANLFMSEIRDLAGEFSGFDESEGATDYERIENTENSIRDLIDARLCAEHGKKYWTVIPSGLSKRAEDRISETEYSGGGDRERLKFIKVNECAQIIDLYWNKFEDVFPSGEDTEHHLSNLEAYKRELQDDNGVDEYTELDGRLAIQWCNSCLETAGVRNISED